MAATLTTFGGLTRNDKAGRQKLFLVQGEGGLDKTRTGRGHAATALAVAVHHRERPVAGRGEEPEVTGRRGDHLGGELTCAVEQPYVRCRDGCVVVRHDAVDHRFLLEV